MLNHINSEEGIIENYGDYSTYIMPILKEGHFIDLRQNTSKLWGIKNDTLWANILAWKQLSLNSISLCKLVPLLGSPSLNDHV